MKREGNLFGKVCDLDNLILADQKARKGKGGQYGIMLFDNNKEENLIALRDKLLNKTFTTSQYATKIITDPKEREVFRLPYYPDRIVHHAAMNIIGPIFTSVFTADTYSCIKGRGIHGAHRRLKRALRDVPGTTYCLKFDLKKFYPSISNDILKQLIRRKFKDPDLLWLLDNIIDSVKGVPIGNYLSQFFANFYVAYLDHYIKEVLNVKYLFRYADDYVILSDDKKYLHWVLAEIRKYLGDLLKLDIKKNYQVFPVSARGIDFLGYVYFHTHILLRKTNKKRFARKVAKGCSLASLASYKGWAQHCNSNHLLKKLLNHEPIQRTRHKHRRKRLYRPENKHQRSP